MANKKVYFGMLVMVLLLVMTLTGCGSTQSSFQSGSGGETVIVLREGSDFDNVFREIVFILNRNGFEAEMVQSDVGYIRTRWINTWNDRGITVDRYRVRVIIQFNPARTQLILNAEAEQYLNPLFGSGRWVRGYDSRAVETLRNDINVIIGQ